MDASPGPPNHPHSTIHSRPTPIPSLQHLQPCVQACTYRAHGIVPFERMAAHCSSLMRRTSIRDPHAVTSPAPPLHPLQPLQTTGHGAEKSAMTSCSRRGSSLHQSGHPHHICIRQARRQGTSGTAANGKQCTCVLVSRFSTTFQSVTVPAFSGAHARCPTRAPALRSRRAERTICDRDVPGGHYPSCSVLLCMCIRSLLPFWLNPRSVSAHYHPSHDGN